MTVLRLFVLLEVALRIVCGQTTQAIITGRVYDQQTGRAIDGARIDWRQMETGNSGHAKSSEAGYYTLLKLAPGIYWIRAESPKPAQSASASGKDYQPIEVYELELFVAGRMQLDIPLRPAEDTYSQSYSGSYLPNTSAIVHTYAADLDNTVSQPLAAPLGLSGTLLSALSYVVDPAQVRDLPLSGRDIYTMLVTLPGVTADNATARGLGLSANGQRSYSTSFLLDGVENNDYLVSGPMTIIAPEAVEEYRVSTNNFSAEYGGTGGLVANAVTRGGSNDWHGVVYAYLNDTSLDANSYQHIAGLNSSTGERGSTALPRQPETDVYSGFWAGGPLITNRWFWSSAFESFRSRGSADPFPFQVPVLSCFEAIAANRASVALLTQYRPPLPTGAGTDCGSLSATYNARIPLQFDRLLGLGRVDYLAPSHTYRILGRLSVSRYDEPDFIYSIYPGFSSGLAINSTGATLAHLWTPRSNKSNELRFGFRHETQGWNRANPAVPEFTITTGSDNGKFYPFGFSLPGSPTPYGFHYKVDSGDLSDVFTIALGRQVLSAGGGLLINRSYTLLSFRADGEFSFSDLRDFALDMPDYLQITVAREGPQAIPALGVAPNYGQSISNNQFYGFIQDNIKVTPKLGLNLGLRYESFGAPRNTGVADGYFQPGPGADIAQRLASGSMVYPTGAHSLYEPDRNNWAPRIGAFYDLLGRGRTVFRASYGIFYDRPFELLTEGVRNNSMEEVALLEVPHYPQVTRTPVPGSLVFGDTTPGLLWVDGHLRTPYVQDWFGGLQHQFFSNLYVEAQSQGGLGRKLISTDVVNRRGATAIDAASGRLNQRIAEDILFRSNAVSSSYTAFSILARYHSRRGEIQAAYTWGHSIDNQSDPLQGTFDDLQFHVSNNGISDNRAGFTRQFQSGADRASSDFDQRQNLVIHGIWYVGIARGGRFAKLTLSGWQVAGIAGFRSGFPFNLIAGVGLPACPGTPDSNTAILRNRPSLLPGRSPFLAQREPVPGGYQVLDPTSFCDPGPATVGNVGRNALTSAGFWNADLVCLQDGPARLSARVGRHSTARRFF